MSDAGQAATQDNTSDINDDPSSGQTQWGIFKDGSLVVQPDTVVSLNFKEEYTDADFPIEQGGFQSYDKVKSPFDVRIRVAKGGSVEDRTAFIQSIDAIMPTTDLYDVNTPEKVFENVNFVHRDFQRRNDEGATMIVMELWGVEIRNTANSSFSNTGAGGSSNSSGGNTQSAGGAGQQNNGITQTEDVRVTATKTIQQQSGGGTGGGGGGGW